MIDGRTNFYADLNTFGLLYDTNDTLANAFLAAGYNALPRSWQGASIAITPGYYRVYYDTIRAQFTPAWQPKPGIFYGILMYVGCSHCVTNGIYRRGISDSDAPTATPTFAPSWRKYLIEIFKSMVFILIICF